MNEAIIELTPTTVFKFFIRRYFINIAKKIYDPYNLFYVQFYFLTH